MMSIKRLFVLCPLCLMTVSVMGQRDAWEDKEKENVGLKSTIATLQIDSTTLSLSVAKLRAQIKGKEDNIAALKKQYAELSALLTNPNIHSLEKEVQELSKTSTSRNSEVSNKRQEIEKAKGQLSDVQNSVTNMDVFSKINDEKQLLELYIKDNKYLDLRFSLMEEEKIADIRLNLNTFAQMADFPAYKKKAETICSLWKYYSEGERAINSAFDLKNVNTIRERLKPYLNVKTIKKYNLTESQFKEIDTLNIRLNRYRNGLRQLQNIITAINESESVKAYVCNPNSHTRQGYVDKVKEYLNPVEGSELDGIYKRYFDMVPYLKTLRDRYFYELKSKDVTFPTKTEKEILETKID